MPFSKQQLKMYSVLTLILVIILIIWAVNFKYSIQYNQQTSAEKNFFVNLNNDWQRIKQNLTNTLPFKEKNKNYNSNLQATSSSVQHLQPSINIKPKDLDKLMNKIIQISPSTSSKPAQFILPTPTSTQGNK